MARKRSGKRIKKAARTEHAAEKVHVPGPSFAEVKDAIENAGVAADPERIEIIETQGVADAVIVGTSAEERNQAAPVPLWVCAFFTDGRCFKVPYSFIKQEVLKTQAAALVDNNSPGTVVSLAQQFVPWRVLAERAIQFDRSHHVEAHQEWRECRIKFSQE